MSAPRKWQGKPPALTAEQFARVQALHAARRAIPRWSEVAEEFGVSIAVIYRAIQGRVKRYEHLKTQTQEPDRDKAEN